MSHAPADGDWSRWIQEAVTQLDERGHALRARHGLKDGTAYHWDLATPSIRHEPEAGSVAFRIQCVGTVSNHEGTFRWGWANDSLPAAGTRDLHRVRALGEAHQLGLLTEAEWAGGHAEALAMLAIAGRVLDADGFWIEPHKDGAIYLVVFDAPTP